MAKIQFMFFIFISFSLLANEKLLYVLGGGGDPAGSDTIFDTDLKNVSKFVKNSDWKTTISFNGGHSGTEKIIHDNFGKGINAGDFVQSNYEKILKDIKEKLENGSLKEGDQLMLLLDTHGAQNMGEESHSIAMARNAAKDLNTLSGASTLSLDSLKPIIELAKEKKVKLAFVDQSCHSGNSLNLPHTDACIISATGAKHYGYSGTFGFLGFSMAFTFAGKFDKLLEPGKNLEDVFVRARLNGDSPDFPMISTPEGLEIQEMLYKLVTPYLYYNNRDSAKFDNMYTVAKIDESICQSSNKFSELMELISNAEKMKKILMSTKDFEQLRKSLEEYRNYQIGYENSYKDLKNVSDEIKNYIKNNYPDKVKDFTESDGVSILNANYDYSIKFYQELLDKETSDFSKRTWRTTIDNLVMKNKIVEEIKSKLSKDSMTKIENQKKMYEKSSVTYDYASKVGTNFKKLYNALYTANKKTESNPCRDFVL